MVTVSNFNSIFEVSLGINAIFVIFDLLPKMDKQFLSSMSMPPDLWEPEMSKEEERYISTYGWKTYAFSYNMMRSWIKNITMINSALSLLVLIFAGFSPKYRISNTLMGLVLIWLLLPVCVWSIYFYTYFPSLRKRLALSAKSEYLSRLHK